MNKPITRRVPHPIPHHPPTGGNPLEKRIAALEGRLATLGQTLGDQAAIRAMAALEAKIDEIVSQKMGGKSAVDPRTLVELVDKRLKEALDSRFRAILGHLESDVIPRAVKKHTTGE